MLPEDDMAGAWATPRPAQSAPAASCSATSGPIDLRLPDRLVMRVTDTTPKDAPGAKKIHAPGKST